MIAAATLTCVFLSSNSFVMAAISSGSRTASRGGLGPFDLSNIIPVHTRNNTKMYLLFNHLFALINSYIWSCAAGVLNISKQQDNV